MTVGTTGKCAAVCCDAAFFFLINNLATLSVFPSDVVPVARVGGFTSS